MKMKLRAKLRETPSYGVSSRSPVGRAQTLEDHFDRESALSHGHTGARDCTEGGWLCRLRGVQILLELSECLRNCVITSQHRYRVWYRVILELQEFRQHFTVKHFHSRFDVGGLERQRVNRSRPS